jgi:hypothetical protein
MSLSYLTPTGLGCSLWGSLAQLKREIFKGECGRVVTVRAVQKGAASMGRKVFLTVIIFCLSFS